MRRISIFGATGSVGANGVDLIRRGGGADAYDVVALTGGRNIARLAQMGSKCIRTIGLARARMMIGLKVITHNVMHLARLQHRGIVPA